MNRRIGLCVLAILIIATGVYATPSPPHMEWIKTIDNITMECSTGKCSQIMETNDGGYFIAGKYGNNTDTSQIPATKISIVKTNSNGDVEWNKVIDMEHNLLNVLCKQTEDNGYVVTVSLIENSLFRMWIIKFDINGNEEFRKIINVEPSYTPSVRSIIQTRDSGYIVAHISGVTKLDSNGDVQWSHNYYTVRPPNYVVNDALPVSDGYILVGRKYDPPDGSNYNLWIEKLDIGGNTTWEKVYIISGYQEGLYVEPTSDGNYIISGMISHPFSESKILLVKIDKNGNKMLDTQYGKPGMYMYFMSAQETSDRGYIMESRIEPLTGGCYQSSGGNIGTCDILLIKTDENGNKLWERTVGGPYSEQYISFDQTFDDKIIVATTEYTSCSKFLTRLIKMSYDTTYDFPYPDACNGPISPTPELGTVILTVIGLIGLVGLIICRGKYEIE